MANEREVSERWAKYKDSITRAKKEYEQRFSQVRILVDHDLKKRVDEYCKKEGMSVAEFMRQAIALRLNE